MSLYANAQDLPLVVVRAVVASRRSVAHVKISLGNVTTSDARERKLIQGNVLKIDGHEGVIGAEML